MAHRLTPSGKRRFTCPKAKEGPAFGQPGVQGMSVQLQTVAEGHVPGGQGMTKHGPLEKRVANHFSILDSRTPRTQRKVKQDIIKNFFF